LQKKRYINSCVNRYKTTISDYKFELCDNILKRYYIDLSRNQLVSLTQLQEEYSKINIKESSNRLWNSYFNNNYIGKL
jgi:hypothetical protein